MRILRRLVLSHLILHRLVLLALGCPVQRRMVDVLHLADVLHRVVGVFHVAEVLYLAVDVVVLHRNVLRPDRFPKRPMPGLSANYDVSGSHRE